MGVLCGLGGCVHHCFGICAIDCIGSSGSASTSRRGGSVAHVGRRGNERAGVGFRLVGQEGGGGEGRRGGGRSRAGDSFLPQLGGVALAPIQSTRLSHFLRHSLMVGAGAVTAEVGRRGRVRGGRGGNGRGGPAPGEGGPFELRRGGGSQIALPGRSPADFPRAQDGFQAAAGRCGGREMQEMRLQKPQGMRLWRLRSAKLQLPYMCTKQW